MRSYPTTTRAKRKALQENLARRRRSNLPPWMSGFGKLHALSNETARIQRLIDREFERIEREDR